MPIYGLTDAPESFLKLGQIRKGEKQEKEFSRRDGSKYTMSVPVDLDYFRVTFAPWKMRDGTDGAALMEKRFREQYGEKPTELNIRLAYPNIRKVWDANFECYKKGGFFASAYSDESGAHWIFRRDDTTNEVIIRNGQALNDEGIRILSQPLDLRQPVYSYKDTKGNMVPVFLEPVGHLKVVIRELADIAVGFFEFRPESPTDIRNVSAELASFDMFAKQAGKDITGVPFILRRREEEVTVRINNQLSRKPSWVVHLDIGGDWGIRAFEVIEHKAIPSVIEGTARDVTQNAPDWTDTPAEWDEPAVEEEVKAESITPEPEPVKLMPRGDDLDTPEARAELRKEFSKKFNVAIKTVNSKALPSLTGKSSAAEIREAIAGIDAAVAAAA
jgi:hypothetical protein